jgi:hypothetical protein
MADTTRSRLSRLRVRRGLLQPPETTLHPRIPLPTGVRERTHHDHESGLATKAQNRSRKRVHSKSWGRCSGARGHPDRGLRLHPPRCYRSHWRRQRCVARGPGRAFEGGTARRRQSCGMGPRGGGARCIRGRTGSAGGWFTWLRSDEAANGWQHLQLPRAACEMLAARVAARCHSGRFGGRQRAASPAIGQLDPCSRMRGSCV